MDVLIVAAAAGAGYIAQQWKDRRRGGQNISESSLESSNSVKDDSSQMQIDKKCPLRRLARREKQNADALEENEGVSQEIPVAEVASTSEFDGEQLGVLGTIERNNVFSTSSLLPGFIANHELEVDQIGVGNSDGIGEIGSSYGTATNRRNLRSRRLNGRSIRPLSSLESCVMAQLYKENVELEGYMLSAHPSPNYVKTVRPFLVTDGNKIISRANSDSIAVQTRIGDSKLHRETYPKGLERISGVPPLPNIGLLEPRLKTKARTGKELGGRVISSSNMAGAKPSRLFRGAHGTLLFCLGISFGIISSFLANRQEVDKLNELLKQTENLVQDLQDELEMKDSLTVKELAVEDYESPDAHEDPFNNKGPDAFSREINLDEPAKDDNKKLHHKQTQDESLSKIEAELEAELEMLELNMNSSTLEGKLSMLVELDPDFIPDIANGELRADVFGRQSNEQQAYADRDGSGSSTPHSANYAVSPRELSLRLHEVLQSRLEERVKELETALENTQRKVLHTEVDHPIPWKPFSRSEAGESSSTRDSPIGKQQENLVDEPVVLNLAGEALDAYNEAYNEFAKINESEEEDSPRLDQDLYWIQNERGTHYMPALPITKATSVYQGREEEEQEGELYLGGTPSGDENEEVDDEMEKLLIKHIVEKARKGSPVVLNAQRALFSIDENVL